MRDLAEEADPVPVPRDGVAQLATHGLPMASLQTSSDADGSMGARRGPYGLHVALSEERPSLGERFDASSRPSSRLLPVLS